MSAPDTDTEKKDPAHKTPLVGMAAVVIFALLLLFGLGVWLSYEGNDPGTDSGVVNGVSTEVEPTAKPELPAQVETDEAQKSTEDTGEGQ